MKKAKAVPSTDQVTGAPRRRALRNSKREDKRQAREDACRRLGMKTKTTKASTCCVTDFMQFGGLRKLADFGAEYGVRL